MYRLLGTCTNAVLSGSNEVAPSRSNYSIVVWSLVINQAKEPALQACPVAVLHAYIPAYTQVYTQVCRTHTHNSLRSMGYFPLLRVHTGPVRRSGTSTSVYLMYIRRDTGVPLVRLGGFTSAVHLVPLRPSNTSHPAACEIRVPLVRIPAPQRSRTSGRPEPHPAL